MNHIPVFALDRSLLGHRGFLLAGIAIWALYGLYWEQAAKGASAAREKEGKGSRRLHVALVNLAFLIEIVPIQGLGRFMAAAAPVMAAGLIIEVAGLSFAVWARRHLGRHWSGEITIKADHELIRSGPYKVLRHPIYTGLLAMYLGLAIISGEWLAAIGLTVAVLAYWRKIRLEEAKLSLAFGAEYDGYRDESWALLPWVF